VDDTDVLVVEECAHIVAGGVGPAPEEHARGARRIDKRGRLVTPVLFYCHYLYQRPPRARR
jgi:hypothetical protein